MNVPKKEDFLAAMAKVAVGRDDPYIRVYPFFVRFFRGKTKFSRDDFVIGANFTYGWMPTILTLAGTNKDWSLATSVLNRAKRGRISRPGDLGLLAQIINGSLVGASKVLHFVNPVKHAIWDGRVYRYLVRREPYHSRVNKTGNYIRYLEVCDEIALWPEITPATSDLARRLCQKLTVFRAIELTMWSNGGKK